MILLVEDNPDDEILTIRALSKNKILNRVEVVRDGAQALDFLFAQGEHAQRDPTDLPELVLLDINLPKLNGLEVLEKIRTDPRTALLPVVMLTTSNEERDRLKSYTLRANSFIRKPVDFDQFSEAIRQLGVYWLVLNQGPPKQEVGA